MTFKKFYYKFIKNIRNKHQHSTEYTLRTDFENLLNSIKPVKSIRIYQESKKKSQIYGKPDFRVEKNSLRIGYIETKPIDTNLYKIIDPYSESRDSIQLKKYLKIDTTLILTNYKQFIIFKNGKKIGGIITLFNIEDNVIDDKNISMVNEIFNEFFFSVPEKIVTPEKLSDYLARRSQVFRDYLKEYIDYKEYKDDFKDKLIGENGLYQLFRETLIEDLEIDEFIDAYVETITYGLFISRLNSKNLINKKNAIMYIPKSTGVIRELFKTIEIDDIPDEISWIIDEIINILNNTIIDELNKNLSFKKSFGNVDPYVYFYENFLDKYDKEKRKAMGVFYTHIPTVNFIIRNINILLKKDFNINGLKDPNVTFLDFATGTGTFLLEAFKQAISEIDEGLKNNIIEEHLLKNFFGFEYMITPYTIAHLKLTQYLCDEGYFLSENERIQVYLTDTLDNSKHKEWSLFPVITNEGKEANKIKLDKHILVVSGNPPYNIHSRNNKPWIKNLIELYKIGLDEKKINIDDDYIKFIRYAHWKIEESGQGIVGIVTNNSYLDTITRRIIRKELINTFDKIYIVNLHGNQKTGDPDENIFNIANAGISITIFVKLKKSLQNKEIYYFSSLDNDIIKRHNKFTFLNNNDITSINWTSLSPCEPYYWYVPRNTRYINQYNKGVSISDIFKIIGSGISTDRDNLFIDYYIDKLENKIKILLSNSMNDDFIKTYRVINSSSYKIINRIKNVKYDPNNIQKINYRPFDTRYIYYQIGITSRPANKIMRHFLNNDNVGLAISKQIVSSEWKHAFITTTLTDYNYISIKTRERTYIAPLFTKNDDDKVKQIRLGKNDDDDFNNPYKNDPNKPNFTLSFIKLISKKYSEIPKPNEIFSYIYSILYSYTYRKKYYEFLKSDFPKIPFPDNKTDFNVLSQLGEELINIHLFKGKINDINSINYPIKGNNLIESINYDESKKKLYINNEQYFDNVTKDIWNYEIGGYQVLNKWVKDRKKITIPLSYDEINKFKKIINIINQSIQLMEKIDESYNRVFSE